MLTTTSLKCGKYENPGRLRALVIKITTMDEVKLPTKRLKIGKSGGQYCSVTGCQSSSYRDGTHLGIKFFRYPADPVRRQRWLEQVQAVENRTSKSLFYMGDHL